jgi:hypothetical protein
MAVTCCVLLCAGLLVVSQGTFGITSAKLQGFRHLADWQSTPQWTPLHLLCNIPPLLCYLISLRHKLFQEKHTLLSHTGISITVLVFFCCTQLVTTTWKLQYRKTIKSGKYYTVISCPKL